LLGGGRADPQQDAEKEGAIHCNAEFSGVDPRYGLEARGNLL
jgi:hypothetical protein